MASLGELTAGIAHEIQNPLNFVNNFSEVNKEMLEELNFAPSDATPICCDNSMAIILSEDHVGHPHVKHIRVKYHYV